MLRLIVSQFLWHSDVHTNGVLGDAISCNGFSSCCRPKMNWLRKLTAPTKRFVDRLSFGGHMERMPFIFVGEAKRLFVGKCSIYPSTGILSLHAQFDF